MSLSNTWKRLILFFTAIPSIVSLILLLPHLNHLAFNVFLIIVSIFGTYETTMILEKMPLEIDTKFFPLLGGVLPTLSYLVIIDILPSVMFDLGLAVLVTMVFVRPVFQRSTAEFKLAFRQLVGYLTVLIYPSFFISFVIRLSGFKDASIIIMVLALLVFLNDSIAWFIGMLLGRTRNIAPVSPNKSLEGFIAGIVTSIAVMVLAKFFFSNIFTYEYWKMGLMGCICGFTTIFGDLVESALKRAVKAGDSGNMILGRGGMLDSLDSALLTAPLYYFFILFMQKGL